MTDVIKTYEMLEANVSDIVRTLCDKEVINIRIFKDEVTIRATHHVGDKVEELEYTKEL